MELASTQPEDDAEGRTAHMRVQAAAVVRVATPALRGAAPVTAGAYAIVALFGVAYWIAGAAGANGAARVTAAGLAAVPVAVGLLWPRLAGFKAFGVEVTLSQVGARVDTTLAEAVRTAPKDSGISEIERQIDRAIARDTEIVEVDLRDDDYWWNTRLFLLAALADDFSSIRRFLFSTGVDRRFVGFAPPAGVRRALGAATPELEQVYAALVAAPSPQGDRVAAIVNQWKWRQFGAAPGLPEEKFKTIVDEHTLLLTLRAVEQPVTRESIDWAGIADAPLVRALVSDFDGAYVALLRHGTLDRVVDRTELVERLAAAAVR
jgi:hypothetical protein